MSESILVRRSRMAGSSTGREFSLAWGDQSRVRELRVWHRLVVGADSAELFEITGTSAIAAFQVLYESNDGVSLALPMIGHVQLLASGKTPAYDDIVRLDRDQIVNGISGHHDNGRINSIGIITQDEQLPVVGDQTGESYTWKLDDLDPGGHAGALVCGLYGFFDAGGITGIGMRVTVDGPGPSVLPWGPGGRVVPVDDVGKAPGIDADRVPAAPAEHPANAGRLDHIGEPVSEATRPNPNHTMVDVRRVDQWDDTLRIHALDGTTTSWTFVGRQPDAAGEVWIDTYEDRNDGILFVVLDPDEPYLDFGDGTRFASPALPAPAAADGPTWDNVFSLEHRVDYLAWASCGLDISRLAPFDLQASTGVLQQHVFRLPRPGSRDFHIANNGKATMVPNGWHFVGDIAGMSGSRMSSAFSAEESRQTWATSLGISAEGNTMGFKVAYRNNSSAHGAVSSATEGKVVSTIVEATSTDHSIVVDLATVELSDGFRRAVDALKLWPIERNIDEFIRRFGTHFAYAVTFGSKSWEQRHETEASVADSMTHGESQDQSLSVGFHSELGGVSGSASWGSQGESSSSTKKGTGSDVSSQGSVGSATEPVPIMLEARDLIELLGPVFFDDPMVYDNLRRRVDEFLDLYPNGLIDFDDTAGELNFDIAPEHKVELLYRVGPTGPLQWTKWGIRYPVSVEASVFLGGSPREFVDEPYSTVPVSPTPPTAEGKILAVGGNRWWIQGGKRHKVLGGPIERLYGTPVNVSQSVVDQYPDSGETASRDGKMVYVTGESSQALYWVSDGKLHPIPTDVVVEVLGGGQLVGGRARADTALRGLEFTTTPASVAGKMIRVADGHEDADKVWVIHERERHLIANDLGVRKRGGWQHVAIVRPEVLQWFPDSGTKAL